MLNCATIKNKFTDGIPQNWTENIYQYVPPRNGSIFICFSGFFSVKCGFFTKKLTFFFLKHEWPWSGAVSWEYIYLLTICCCLCRFKAACVTKKLSTNLTEWAHHLGKGPSPLPHHTLSFLKKPSGRLLISHFIILTLKSILLYLPIQNIWIYKYFDHVHFCH